MAHSRARRSLFLLGALLLLAPASRAEMPPAAAALVRDMKLSPEVTSGWEDEQAVPQAWLEAAKKEGKLRINGSWEPRVFQALAKPFFERYPFLKPTYTRGANATRVGAALVAFGEGRITTDIVTGIDSSINDFRAFGALAPIGDLPTSATFRKRCAAPTVCGRACACAIGALPTIRT
jgi:hypothetical protein